MLCSAAAIQRRQIKWAILLSVITSLDIPIHTSVAFLKGNGKACIVMMKFKQYSSI
jgi:hypothetical protein